MRHYRTLALKELLAQRVTSVLILLAVILSTMMTAVTGQSMGVLSAMRQQQAIAIGGNRYAGFVQMDGAQLETLKNDPRLSFVGSYVVLGNLRLDNTLNLGLSEFQEDVRAVYPSISALREGRLPQAPMEIALPEDVLGYLGFDGKLGDTLTLSLSKALRHGVMTQSYDFTAVFTLVGVTESNYLNYAAGVIHGIVGPGTAETLLPEEYFYYNVDIRIGDKKTFQATMDDLVSTLNVHELDTTYNIPYLNALGIRYSQESADVTDVSENGFPFMMAAGILGIPLALLAAGIAFGGGLSTMNSCITTPPRTLFAMARDGMLPQIFTKIHPKYKTPYVSILFLGVIALLLTLTNSVQYVASVSLFADLFFYVIGIISAGGLRKKHPELYRPYKAPAAGIGIPVSAVIYIIMMTQLGFSAIISGVVWCVFGMILYYAYSARSGAKAAAAELPTEPPEEPSDEERRAMDREYKLWRAIVAAAAAAALMLYIVPYFLA